MRLSMTVNGATPIVAAVSGPGYLSAHLNMKDRPNEENGSGASIGISGFQTEETTTVSLKWPILDLNVGDVIQLVVLPEGEGNTPTRVRLSSESPYNLFSGSELARELLQAVSDFEERLVHLLDKSHDTEPPDEHKKFMSAYANVAWEVGQNFLHPVYRRHKDLVPEQLKGDLL